MRDYNDNRSITKQTIDNFELETVQPILSRPAWGNDFAGVNVDDRSSKLPVTYREPHK